MDGCVCTGVCTFPVKAWMCLSTVCMRKYELFGELNCTYLEIGDPWGLTAYTAHSAGLCWRGSYMARTIYGSERELYGSDRAYLIHGMIKRHIQNPF